MKKILLLVLIFLPSIVFGATITFSGSVGGNIVNYTMAGDNIVNVMTATPQAFSTVTMNVPTTNVQWNGLFVSSGVAVNSGFDQTVSISAPHTISGNTVGLITTIENVTILSAGGGFIRFDNDGTPFDYPAVNPGEIITYQLTSGSFTLTSGTYDTVFNVGNHNLLASSPAQDGTLFQLVITAPVPEPSTYALLSLLGLGFLLYRRRTSA